MDFGPCRTWRERLCQRFHRGHCYMYQSVCLLLHFGLCKMEFDFDSSLTLGSISFFNLVNVISVCCTYRRHVFFADRFLQIWCRTTKMLSFLHDRRFRLHEEKNGLDFLLKILNLSQSVEKPSYIFMGIQNYLYVQIWHLLRNARYNCR